MSAGIREASKPLTGLRVLLVEDHWHLMEALRLTIERSGGTVIAAAATLEETERLVAKGGFDAVVMDLNLQNVMATPLVERMSESGIKVILVTAYQVGQELARKVHDVLRKPTPPDVLIAALARVGNPG